MFCLAVKWFYIYIYQIVYLYNASPLHYISLYRHVQYLDHLKGQAQAKIIKKIGDFILDS